METILALIAIPSMLIAPFAGWMTFSFYRDGETEHAMKAGAVFAVTAFVLFLGYNPGKIVDGGDCYTDWDGRSNAVVCD